MSLAQLLSTYCALNLYIASSFILLKVIILTATRFNKRMSSVSELKLNYLTLLAIVAATFVHPFLPRSTFFQPVLKVWSAESIKTFSKTFSVADQGGFLAVPYPNGYLTVGANQISHVILDIGAVVLTFGAFLILKDLRTIIKIRRSSYRVRKINSVSIYANDEIAVPFSFWLPRNNDLIVPSTMLGDSQKLKISILHELQHHRQGDTRYIYLMWLLRIICVINPLIHVWSRWLSELQEFACDEALVGRNKVESLQYARCLVEVAEDALNQKFYPVSATGLTFLIEQKLLKRRVQQMLSVKNESKFTVTWVFASVIAAAIAATSFATGSLVQDRRISLPEAQKMAATASSNSEFPAIEVNDLVLKQLNRYLGTPEGREFMKQSLVRMQEYRDMIERKLTESDVPRELMAVPIVESGFQNLMPTNAPRVGAGIWMFMAQTARELGLTVNSQVDERLDSTILTDAAMRYFKSAQSEFSDWRLALLAYNSGPQSIRRGIEATGSKDPWTLVRAGYEGDKDYLSKVLAVILIMRNPDSLN